MRLTIITDAWEVRGQVNGVVTTLTKTIEILKTKGYKITIIHPDLFFGFSLPNYKEVKISLNIWKMARLIENSNPDSIHIFTEGPLGLSARLYCSLKKYRFTTSYHTRFPEYIDERLGFGLNVSYRYLKWFHNKSYRIMVNTNSMEQVLSNKGFKNIVRWGRGVDTKLFTPNGRIDNIIYTLPKPIWLNVGRVSIEKNLTTFYDLDLPGTKVQVGTGPVLEKYKKEYTDVVFLGLKRSEDLAACYRGANYFVFPSVTDTFGLVMLEALACGIPVAALPATGPSDVLIENRTGIIKESLQDSCNDIQRIWDKQFIRDWAISQSWENCTEQFNNNLVNI